jgi:hypothetical protein
MGRALSPGGGTSLSLGRRFFDIEIDPWVWWD